VSAGQLNENEQFESAEILRNAQRILKPIKVINPYAMYLELPMAVFKPRRTNSHYLQFIEAITFYKQYQREQKANEDTGEMYIETTIEDIQEANELIAEVLLRKSDTLTGATRNHLENLKSYLAKKDRNTFTNAEIRRNLRIKETTLRRYNNQLLAEGYIYRLKRSKTKSYSFEIVDIDEYTDLHERINSALNICVSRLSTATPPPSRHLQNGEVKKQKAS
jgi:predicted transcriptional regulator